MRPQLFESPLTTLLRQCYLTPSCQAARYARKSPIGLHRGLQTSASHQAKQKKVKVKTSPTLTTTQVTEPLQPFNYDSAPPITPSKVPKALKVAPPKTAPQVCTGKSAEPDVLNVAVVGGGIAGLATVHYLLKAFPSARVTLFEEKSELGGWIKSKRVEVKGGSIVLEQGPRTLMPGTASGIATLGLVCQAENL